MNHINGRASRVYLKKQRAESVAGIVVEVLRADGTVLQFDGDEESQKRLDRFCRRAQANGRESLPWKLADNSVIDVTPDEMEQALDKALEAQSACWFV